MPSPKHMLITAGPTHERIDDVRYLANRSSGRMGVALAEAAREAGLAVTLLLGPTAIDPPDSVRVARFESAADLEALLTEHFPACDVLVMAAAVADYRPVPRSGKLPRTKERLVLDLEPTPDLVAACAARRRPEQRIVAFALEDPADLERRAVQKLAAKGVDAIVANPLETMGSADVSAVVYTADGRRIVPGSGNPPPGGPDKAAFARWLIRWIVDQM